MDPTSRPPIPSDAVIAIDGPAASGKSTVARRLAKALGFEFVSTGEMYRAVAWLFLRNRRSGASSDDPQGVDEILRLLEIHPPVACFAGGSCLLRLGDLDPMPHLHDWDVAATVSEVARVPQVREKLVAVQRQLASGRGVVMEGRDIGTVVFPNTPFKFFIDAAPQIREARRKAQGRADSIAERDRKDSSRAVSPLLAAADAIIIDSSSLSVEEVVDRILESLAAHRAPEPLAGSSMSDNADQHAT